jgi:predicted HAD superfamily Cof-like phosphohydrolase
MNAAEMVLQFHTAFNLPRRSSPDPYLVIPEAALRLRLLLEETQEVLEAVEAEDLEAIAQELADVVYIVYGTALTYGIDLDAVLAEVHRANMSKLDENGNPILREDGKVLKSSLFRQANVAAIIGLETK